MKFICKCCKEKFKFPKKYFNYYEQNLWGHIQLEHEEKFEDVQNLETPYMLEECYE